MAHHNPPTSQPSANSTIAPPTPLPHSITPVAPISPSSDGDFKIDYEGPLYTEIKLNIPRIPTKNMNIHPEPTFAAQPDSCSSSPPHQNSPMPRLRTLMPLPHRSSSSSKESEEWPRIRRDIVKSRETAATMDLGHRSKRGRRGTIGALAVVPAVLVLSAELFTPGTGGEGRWRDGIR